MKIRIFSSAFALGALLTFCAASAQEVDAIDPIIATDQELDALDAIEEPDQDVEPVDPVVPPIQEVEPVVPIVTPADARTHGLESLRIAVKSDGGVPLSPQLNEFLKAGPDARKAAIELGKSLFWEMGVGSDGVQACASCHFHAGADNRSRNEVSPNLTRIVNDRMGDIKGFHEAASASDTSFQTKLPDQTVTPEDFPFVKEIQSFIDNNGVIEPSPNNSNDVLSSMGISFTLFKRTIKGEFEDRGKPLFDPVFNNGYETTRRVEPRNTPTVINAVFNFTNFWDGRANNRFNGENPFGEQDPNAKVFVLENDELVEKKISLENASLASQAVGPPTSHFEMSFGDPDQQNARSFAEIGKKLLRGPRPLVPLGQQLVSPDDSVLGALSNYPKPGLNTNYKKLIRQAFQNKYWAATKRRVELTAGGVTALRNDSSLVSDVLATVVPTTLQETGTYDVVSELLEPTAVEETLALSVRRPRFTQMEANFSLFFGISVMLYESTLVADRTGFDRWMETGRLTKRFGEKQLRGLNLFVGQGHCVNCHGGPELTKASVRNAEQGKNVIEAMQMAQGTALYDNGFYNISVTPTTDDLGRGGKDLNGQPLAFSRQSLFQRVLGINMPFPITGDDFIPAVDEDLGQAVCTDTNHDGFCGPSEPLNPEFQRAAVDGAFKVPGLRNVALTGPFFHNGGFATLKQVVQFYNRGGNFCRFNLDNLDPDIQGLGLTREQESDLVAFLVSLTDGRVRRQKAPFDHPELFIPVEGRAGTELMRIEQVGAQGADVGLKPFLGLGQQKAIFRPKGVCSKDPS